jgi:hypothetical protein
MDNGTIDFIKYCDEIDNESSDDSGAAVVFIVVENDGLEVWRNDYAT